ncbi:serine/threonine-protein phosphatase 4 regulatory subunit 1-like isoform X3 [Leptopilina heterotoma]|uniref:serine/threonine-protein phosphatase 4 regulatory subunit 1-like isoform X3 n=1 Tax=Leptopilina heterotoma TaxID=63436 RepID=UPI001CA9C3D1|nr:serine/threonine-protein phosphatase 4 regulatory subunit 1-like isoform X3 [Leptopilina heterotoma]
MADISYLQNEDLEDSMDAVEDEEEEDDENYGGAASPYFGGEGGQFDEEDGGEDGPYYGGAGGQFDKEDADYEGDENDGGGQYAHYRGCLRNKPKNAGCGQMLMHFEQLLQNSRSQTTFNRQMVGRILLEYFKSAVESNSELNFDEVFNTVNQIISDPEPSIRLDLVEQLPHVAIICHETPHLFGDALSCYIIEIILKYLRDTDNQVRQMAQTALIAIVERGILTKKQLEVEVCPVILNMTYLQIEFLNTAIVLMSKLGPYLGSEVLETILLDRYLELCEDERFFVRKVCASYLGEICANISKSIVYEKLLPKYINLCIDDVWGVRKACVDVMLSVASCVTIYKYRMILSKLLMDQLSDESKWVRTSAHQILGPFISIFATQFSGLRYNQFGDFVMSHNQGSELRQNIIPSTKNESVVGPNDNFATPLEQEIGIIGIDTYTSNKRNKRNQSVSKNDMMFFPLTGWLGEIVESEEQNDSSGESSGDDVNKFNPFQYYYNPPEMPLDLELVRPSDKSSQSEDIRKMFDDYYDLEYENQISDIQPPVDDSAVSPSSQQQEEPQLDKENLNKPSEISIETSSSSSSSPESNNLNSDSENTDKTVDNSSTIVDQETEKSNEESSTNSENIDDNSTQTITRVIKKDYPAASSMENNTLPSLLKGTKAKDEKTDESVPQFLIARFISMADPAPLFDYGTELHHQCAFYFPAVVMTLGRKNWFQLKNAYQALACAVQWKVRCTLASSIHEIALILGEELTSTDLMPIYDGFIKDLDEVRIGALKHLSTFLEVLRPVNRQKYLSKLSDFIVPDNENNWRFREEFANQLLQAILLYQPQDISEHIAPLALQLLQDKVAAVRQIALQLITQITRFLGSEEPLVIALIQELNHQLLLDHPLIFRSKWKCRQTYALICSQLISTESINLLIFVNEMLPHLFILCEDKVPNVRLVVARTLTNDILPLNIDRFNIERTWQAILKLKQDTDRDVRVLAGASDPKESNDQSLNHTFLLDAF